MRSWEYSHKVFLKYLNPVPDNPGRDFFYAFVGVPSKVTNSYSNLTPTTTLVRHRFFARIFTENREVLWNRELVLEL